MHPLDIILHIKSAYTEGYSDYDSPCLPNTRFKDQWNASQAKAVCDELSKLVAGLKPAGGVETDNPVSA